MVKIVSDSSTMFSIEEGSKINVDIAPLSVTINNKTYKEYEEISTEEFIRIINEGYIPMSSQPPIGEVVEIYENYPNEEIINICMADGLSGTYNSACTAKNMVDNSQRIEVINSKTLCGPHGYMVEVAAELAKMDKSKEEIIKAINEIKESSKSFLIPHDFDYLVRGGRLSPLVGRIGSAIKLVPVMILSDDGKSLCKFTTKRTLQKAIKKICDELISSGINEEYQIYISHACREDLANTSKNIILDNIENINIEIKQLGPAFTTQGGPGCIAIQTVKKYKV